MKKLTFLNIFLTLAATMLLPLQADEASALKTLASADASLHDKAMACDELGRVGTAKAVPALVEFLSDEKLHDYARDGLERIPDPAAGKALLASWKDLKGQQRIGVIISLGDRGEKGAVPRLARIAKGKNKTAASAALTSLAQIATDEAAEAILVALSESEGDRRIAAVNAVKLAAQKLEKAGRTEVAAKLRGAIHAKTTASVGTER